MSRLQAVHFESVIKGVEDGFESVIKGVENGDPTIIGILVSIFVVLVTIIFFVVRSRTRNNRQGILLLGICDAGKTLIYTQIVHKCLKDTYTSIKANFGNYTVPEKNKSLKVVDLPGHERIRGQLLDEFKDTARGIVFVVDSGSLQKEVKEVAEYLYTLLSDPTISTHAPPILILCNKQDLTLAKGAKVIRSQLEKEITTLRVTRSAALQGTDDSDSNFTFLGRRDKDFDFSDLKPLNVEFAECSARGEGELGNLCSWMSKVA